MNAKRGDLVVVEYHKEYNSDPVFEVERVDGVNRDGHVMRTVRYSFDHESQPELFYRNQTSRGNTYRRYRVYSDGTCWIVPADTIYVLSAWEALHQRQTEHYWDPHTFSDLESAKQFLLPFRKETQA